MNDLFCSHHKMNSHLNTKPSHFLKKARSMLKLSNIVLSALKFLAQNKRYTVKNVNDVLVDV